MHLRHVHGSVRARGHATASSIRARLRRLRRRRVARVRDDDTMASCTWWWRRRRIALAAAMAMCARDVTPPRRPRARGRGGGGNQIQRGLTGERLRHEAAAAAALAWCAGWRSDALESRVGARVRARECVCACRRAPLAPQARRRAGRRAARAQSQPAVRDCRRHGDAPPHAPGGRRAKRAAAALPPPAAALDTPPIGMLPSTSATRRATRRRCRTGSQCTAVTSTTRTRRAACSRGSRAVLARCSRGARAVLAWCALDFLRSGANAPVGRFRYILDRPPVRVSSLCSLARLLAAL